MTYWEEIIRTTLSYRKERTKREVTDKRVNKLVKQFEDFNSNGDWSYGEQINKLEDLLRIEECLKGEDDGGPDDT